MQQKWGRPTWPTLSSGSQRILIYRRRGPGLLVNGGPGHQPGGRAWPRGQPWQAELGGSPPHRPVAICWWSECHMRIGQQGHINDQLATVFRSINLYLYFASQSCPARLLILCPCIQFVFNCTIAGPDPPSWQTGNKSATISTINNKCFSSCHY